MDLTIKAILARFGGDIWEAEQYCKRVAEASSNPHLSREYGILAIAIRMQMSNCRIKAEAAHAS